MNESERLADQLTKALNGDAWHGPSWREVLEGITREAALHHPISEAHSIAEIVLHATTWHDVVRRRLVGESPEISETELVLAAMRLEDWPPATLTDESAWETAHTHFFETGNALAQTVATFPPEKLHEKRPAVDGTWYELIMGGLQHVLYHAGQVSLLKKAGLHVDIVP